MNVRIGVNAFGDVPQRTMKLTVWFCISNLLQLFKQCFEFTFKHKLKKNKHGRKQKMVERVFFVKVFITSWVYKSI